MDELLAGLVTPIIFAIGWLVSYAASRWIFRRSTNRMIERIQGKGPNAMDNIVDVDYSSESNQIAGSGKAIRVRIDAKNMGIVLTASGLATYGKMWSTPIGWSVKSFAEHQIGTFERLHHTYSGG